MSSIVLALFGLVWALGCFWFVSAQVSSWLSPDSPLLGMSWVVSFCPCLSRRVQTCLGVSGVCLDLSGLMLDRVVLHCLALALLVQTCLDLSGLVWACLGFA